MTLAGQNGPGAWSATGEHIFFSSVDRPDKESGIYEVDSKGANAQKLLAAVDAHGMHASHDGRFLVFEQTLAVRKGRDAGIGYLREFIEDAKASGFVTRALAKSGNANVPVSPPVR